MKNLINLNQKNKALFLIMGLAIAMQLLLSLSVSAQSLRPRVVEEKISTQVLQTTKRSGLSYEVRYSLLTMQGYTVFDWIEATTNTSGDVTLRGQATTPETKERAEAIIEQIAGVNKINNQIEVLPTSDTDRNLRRQLYRAVYNQNTPLSRYAVGTAPTIHIVVKNGAVELRGNVDSSSDSEMAFVAANAVPRVFRVTNSLKINNSMVSEVMPNRFR